MDDCRGLSTVAENMPQLPAIMDVYKRQLRCSSMGPNSFKARGLTIIAIGGQQKP